ncbi:MAG: MoaD/ThiS family protein [Dehalococcoidia bacterium]|nr:MoaD/ThiS family protein [Dehalococcoidia bacterium]
MERQRVKVLYYGLIRTLMGTGTEEVELPKGATVGELIEALASHYGERFREHLMAKDGNVHRNVRIFVSDRDIGRAEGLNTRLNGEGQVTFVVTVSQMSGG